MDRENTIRSLSELITNLKTQLSRSNAIISSLRGHVEGESVDNLLELTRSAQAALSSVNVALSKLHPANGDVLAQRIMRCRTALNSAQLPPDTKASASELLDSLRDLLAQHS